jgi:tetratricopeptide (TPR) repeat protein
VTDRFFPNPIFRETSNPLPLEPPDQHHCEAALGYCELGMYGDANDELERIDPLNRATPDVLRIRAIYHGLEKWDGLQVVAARLCEFEPANVQWTVSLAYATRRAVSIERAKDILLAALPRFPDEGIIQFNLACYYCQLGDLQTAKEYLGRVFTIDSNWRAAAMEDKDLEPLWDSLGRDDCPVR